MEQNKSHASKAANSTAKTESVKHGGTSGKSTKGANNGKSYGK